MVILKANGWSELLAEAFICQFVPYIFSLDSGKRK